MRITSRENRQIKEIAKLYKNGRSRKENGLFVVEGARICADAAESGIEIVTLVCSDTGAARYPDAVKALSDAAGRRISVPDAVFAALADTAHPQGILAVCRMPELSLRPEDIRPDGRYLGLEDLRDPANLGTIARTAEALALDGLILSPGCCDPYGSKALRAGMGSLLRIPLLQTEDFLASLDAFRKAGLPVFAAVPDRSAADVRQAGLHRGGVVLIGNEGNGLSPEAVAFSDRPVTIPMPGRAESLNAAAAASILMWEMTRSREGEVAFG